MTEESSTHEVPAVTQAHDGIRGVPSRSRGALLRTSRLRILAAVVAALAISAGATSVMTAGANTNTPTVTYYACVSTVGGVPYNIQTTGVPKCLGKDQSISWNQTGPAGAPGTNGTNGPMAPTAPTARTAPTERVSPPWVYHRERTAPMVASR